MDGIGLLLRILTARWAAARGRRDDGYTTESVIVTALLAALAITVIGIIAAKVVARAGGLNV